MHASYSSTFSCRTVNFLKEHNHVFAHVREFDFFMDRCHDNHEFKDEGTLYQVFFAQVYTMCESLITHHNHSWIDNTARQNVFLESTFRHGLTAVALFLHYSFGLFRHNIGQYSVYLPFTKSRLAFFD